MQDNRVTLRRQADLIVYSDCPKYLRHDLSDDQILQIATKAAAMAVEATAERAAELAIVKAQEMLKYEIGRSVFDNGPSILFKSIVIIAVFFGFINSIYHIEGYFK